MWEQQAERGTPLAITALLWITRMLGRPVARVVLYPVTTYFLMTGSAARRASRDFLSRVLPRPPGWRDVARHFFTFAAVSLDRFLWLTGASRTLHVARSAERRVGKECVSTCNTR